MLSLVVCCVLHTAAGGAGEQRCAEWRSCGTGTLFNGSVGMGPVPSYDGSDRYALLRGGVVAACSTDNAFSQWVSVGGIPRSLQLVWWSSQWPRATSAAAGAGVGAGAGGDAAGDAAIDSLSCAIGTLSCLLKASADFREEMAQTRGFVLLQHILRDAQPHVLTVQVVDAAVSCAIACKPFRRLFVSAVRSILCEFRVWCNAPWSTQFHVRRCGRHSRVLTLALLPVVRSPPDVSVRAVCTCPQWLQRLGNLVPGAPTIFHRVLGVQRVLDALHRFYSLQRWEAGTKQEPGLPSVQVYGKLVAKVLANMLPPPDLSTSEGRAAAIAVPRPRYTELKAILSYCFSR